MFYSSGIPPTLLFAFITSVSAFYLIFTKHRNFGVATISTIALLVILGVIYTFSGIL